MEIPCLSSASRRWISYSLLPTFRRQRELKLFKDMMAFLVKLDAATRLAMHSGLSRNNGTTKFSCSASECVEPKP